MVLPNKDENNQNIFDSVTSSIGDAIESGVDTVTNAAESFYEDGKNFLSNMRGKNLPKNGEAKKSSRAIKVITDLDRDWRVRLSVPKIPPFSTSHLLNPLRTWTSGHLVFPYTPTIIMQHNAHYNSSLPTHANYSYRNYVNSEVSTIQLIGEFTVENTREGMYWIAAVHYLRSITKMFYGDEEPLAGQPPVIVRLNGYGDYVYNNVPVVVENFTVDMQPDVDYIATSVGGTFAGPTVEGEQRQVPYLRNREGKDAISYVPTKSTISVAIAPIYSRKTVSEFSLTKFVNGDYINKDSGFV